MRSTSVDAEHTQALPSLPAAPAPTGHAAAVYARHHPGADPRPARPPARPVPATRRRRRALPLAVAVVSLLAVGAVIALLLDRRDQTDLAADPGALSVETVETVGPAETVAPVAPVEPAAPTPETGAAAPEEIPSDTGAEEVDAPVRAGFQVHQDPAFQVAVPEG